MLNIKRVTATCNTKSTVTYPYKDKVYTDLVTRLKAEHGTQGAFYQACCGVSSDNAAAAGWHPEDSIFYEGCDGWKQFLADKGKLKVTTIEEDVPAVLFCTEE